jgi:hypothetical protein
MNTATHTNTAAAAPLPHGKMEVLDYIHTTIRSLVRTGGMDSAETEQIAITALADLCRLKIPQARELWIRYAATYAETLIH